MSSVLNRTANLKQSPPSVRRRRVAVCPEAFNFFRPSTPTDNVSPSCGRNDDFPKELGQPKGRSHIDIYSLSVGFLWVWSGCLMEPFESSGQVWLRAHEPLSPFGFMQFNFRHYHVFAPLIEHSSARQEQP